jgi:site-specific recombinase XerD
MLDGRGLRSVQELWAMRAWHTQIYTQVSQSHLRETVKAASQSPERN